MNKEERKKIAEILSRGLSAYVYYSEEDIVIRYQRVDKTLMCYPKGKGRKPKEFNFKDNTYAQDALVFGEPTTKEIYEKF